MNLSEFSREFGLLAASGQDYPALIAEGQKLLGKLLAGRNLIAEAAANIFHDESFLQGQLLTLDPNELTLFRSPDGNFSLRLFIWEPGVTYPAHDHGSWGVVGAWAGEVEEVKFRRLDDGSREGFADLAVESKASLTPGKLTAVLPLNDGIHRMRAVGDLPALTVHAYGIPVRKGYIQYFDPAAKKLAKVFAPKLNRKIVVLRALASVGEEWSRQLLAEVARDKNPQLRDEARLALQKMRMS
ncbi:MAG TPA: cysteine dioxygenase family protein [Bacillota bacterium]|nr:cysteine dioxygenase family protein [Bacillota bacterium]